jgi:hypothetical protein
MVQYPQKRPMMVLTSRPPQLAAGRLESALTSCGHTAALTFAALSNANPSLAALCQLSPARDIAAHQLM